MFDDIAHVVRQPMQICCEDCREDETGALYIEADRITAALLAAYPELTDVDVAGVQARFARAMAEEIRASLPEKYDTASHGKAEIVRLLETRASTLEGTTR
ncbi:hypothetical protein [Aeromicrobium sp. 179-A 4D2 NHS]|uniref:hypothetical protein n=1 Tax=Aeromicrobium sp. 179-A 4D2 NHS TaxID=3142375 RepID=UPI00399EF507